MSVVRWSAHVYRLLVRAYPAQIRADFGEEMIWCFEASCADKLHRRGAWGVLVYWLHVLPDWAFTVTKERLQQHGYQGVEPMETIQFNQQFTSTLALFSRALRAGYNVRQVFGLIAEHAPEPTRSFAARICQEVDSGATWVEAFQKASQQSGSLHTPRLLQIFQEQIANGGNLADKVDAYNRELYAELGDQGWAKQIDLGDDYDTTQDYPLN